MRKSTRRLTLPGLIVSLTLLPVLADAGQRHARHRQDTSAHRMSDSRRSGPATSSWKQARSRRHTYHHRQHHSVCERLAAYTGESTSHHKWIRFLTLFFGCEAPPPSPEYPQAPPPLATLVDEAGAPFADLGRVETDHTIIEVPAASSFADPIVMLGPPTRRDADPGVVQLQGVDGDSFRVRFREWTYLDGVHAAETVSYLILAPGRHRLADGSEWEVGSLDAAEAGSFWSQTFTAPFASPPALFLTIQTQSEDDPVVVRARDVSESGFQAELMEEEGADGVHGSERIGYLAISSPPGSGQLMSESGALPYLVSEVLAGHLSVPVLSGSLSMEEEASADTELDHADETLAFLAIGPQVFAQAMTNEETDPATVRRSALEHYADVEWGTVSSVDGVWRTIPLAREYVDPIVIVGPASWNGGDAGVLRTRNVRSDAFELRFQEWAYLDGTHVPERAFYLVADRGIQDLGGLMIEAGYADSSAVLEEGLQDIAFTFPFPDVPGVFASVSTDNDPQPATVRVSDRTALGFGMAMQVEEASTSAHGVERLSWIAIQSGQGTTSDGRSIRVFETAVDQMVATVPLGEGLRGRFPSVLGQIVSVFGTDPVNLRFRDLTSDSIGLVATEEKSADDEVGHLAEDVSVFVAE